jgi:hypothetical protein
MKNFIEKLSTTKCLLLIFGGFMIAFVLSNTVFSQDFTYLTQTFNYSSEYAYSLMNSIGEAGRSAHLLILMSDLIMVILYTNFLLGINYRLSCGITKNCHAITIVTFSPIILTMIQFGEIVANAMLVLNYKKEYVNIAHLANSFTIIKFNLTAIFFGLPLVLLCVNILLKLIRKRKVKFEG